MKNYQPFDNIDNLTIYHNKKYYDFIDGIHIKEIFNVENDILCVFYLNNYKNCFDDCKYIDILYTNKIIINNLNYNTKLSYITINHKSNELLVLYNITE